MNAARIDLRLMALILLLGLTWGCSRNQPPNVLFIVVDTLRWDHLGCYGYERKTSPSIDTLASESVRFERAYSAAPWTKPSVASMITGLYPSTHGAARLKSVLPASIDTLAEILSREGFQTAGVVSHLLVSALLGFGQGFDSYLERESRGHDHVSTNGITNQAIERLEKMTVDGRPFLLFVHYFDPHYNYVRHPEYGFAAEAGGRLTGTENINQLRRMLDSLTHEEIGFLLDLYDEEIRFTDAGIGRLLGRFRELGLYDDALIILTSDHGEEFLERGWLGHTRSLYEELVHVPLIIRLPGSETLKREVPDPVSLVSLTPTILDVLGIDTSALGFQEASIAPYLSNGRTGIPRLVFAEVDFRGVDQRKTAFKKAVITDRFKLIRDDHGGVEEIYELDTDPGERRNLATERPLLADKLRPILEEQLRRLAKGPVDAREIQFSADEIETLRGLGYIGP